MGSGTRDLSILLDAVPRCVSVRVLPRNSGVLCFACRRSGSVLFRPARSRQQDVSRPCASMATQAWLNGETGATAAAGAEARAAQPGVAEARAVQPGPRGTSRGDIVAHVRMVHLRTAHNFMSKWRKKTDGTAETEKDLTDRQDFDWVGYLKAYPNLSVIVPDGKVVVRFAIARLAIIDTNTRTGRVDFLLFLDDGICVRLHPSQTKEALPVIVPADRTGILFGRKAMSDTVLEVKRGSHVVEARAAQPGVADGRAAQPAPPEKSRDHFKGASESDILMPSFVLSWLAERAALWPTVNFCQERDHDAIGASGPAERTAAMAVFCGRRATVESHAALCCGIRRLGRWPGSVLPGGVRRRGRGEVGRQRHEGRDAAPGLGAQVSMVRLTGSPACHDTAEQPVTGCAWHLAFRFNRAAQGAHGAAQLVFSHSCKARVCANRNPRMHSRLCIHACVCSTAASLYLDSSKVDKQ